jgi:hypothetical protein
MYTFPESTCCTLFETDVIALGSHDLKKKGHFYIPPKTWTFGKNMGHDKKFVITIWMKADKFSQVVTAQCNGRQRMQRMIQTEFPLWNKSKYSQQKWKKDILPTEKLKICEIVLCGLATRSLYIITEMPIAENSIHYRVVIDSN